MSVILTIFAVWARAEDRQWLATVLHIAAIGALGLDIYTTVIAP